MSKNQTNVTLKYVSFQAGRYDDESKLFSGNYFLISTLTFVPLIGSYLVEVLV